MSILRAHTTVLLAAAALAAGTAFGQAAPSPTPAAVPVPKCEMPGVPPSSSSAEMGKSAQEAKRVKWINNSKAYIDCLKRFIEEQQAAASPHIKASNAAVEEYNKAIKTFNEQLDAP